MGAGREGGYKKHSQNAFLYVYYSRHYTTRPYFSINNSKRKVEKNQKTKSKSQKHYVTFSKDPRIGKIYMQVI